jgi:hypothetical protein
VRFYLQAVLAKYVAGFSISDQKISKSFNPVWNPGRAHKVVREIIQFITCEGGAQESCGL